jgi:hypothetical protein
MRNGHLIDAKGQHETKHSELAVLWIINRCFFASSFPKQTHTDK